MGGPPNQWARADYGGGRRGFVAPPINVGEGGLPMPLLLFLLLFVSTLKMGRRRSIGGKFSASSASSIPTIKCLFLLALLLVILFLCFCALQYGIMDGTSFQQTNSWWMFRLGEGEWWHSVDNGDDAQRQQQMAAMNRSRMRLDYLELVRAENNEELPVASAFGTIGPLALICVGNDSARCVRPFRHLETRWRVAPKYGLVGCLIQKSLSTLLEAVMCLLFDERRFMASGRTLLTELSKTRLCRRQNEFGQLGHLREALSAGGRLGGAALGPLDKFTFFAIVRDPVQRFLSGFVDKCVRQPHSPHFCLGCGTNLSCFVRREYGRMMEEATRFRMAKSFEDRHFFPQNWRCNFRSMLANYTLLRVPSSDEAAPHQQKMAPSPAPFADRLMALLVRHGRISEATARFLRQQLDPTGANKGSTLHTTAGTRVRRFFDQRLRTSPHLMEFVVRMFWHDFHLLHFPIPKMGF